MNKKIFVSYKYADHYVEQLDDSYFADASSVRDYVDVLELKIGDSGSIYKGESDGEDLSGYSDEFIWEKLKDRIYDSTVTVVMISPLMREDTKTEREQWIPWEIAYSLREQERNDRTSHSNAILAVVLPDKDGKYSYFFREEPCGTLLHLTDSLFGIMAKNMFNEKNPVTTWCERCVRNHHYGQHSYIMPVKWEDFVNDINRYIEEAVERQRNIDKYNICKEI